MYLITASFQNKVFVFKNKIIYQNDNMFHLYFINFNIKDYYEE